MTRTPLSRSKGQRSRSPGRFTHRGLNTWGRCSGERIGRGNYCYVASARRRARRWGAHGGGEGRGHIVSPRAACFDYTKFLPARRLLARSAVVTCLSVCPSVTLVYCIQMAEEIIKLLSRPGRRMILSIDTCRFRWPWVTFDPHFKSRHFWSRISEKRRVLKTKLLFHTNRKLYLTHGMVLCLVTLTAL